MSDDVLQPDLSQPPETALPAAEVSAAPPVKVLSPFRMAVLRGLGAFLAPLLTVVILVWVWQTLKSYVLEPVTQVVRDVAVWSIADIYVDVPPDAVPDPQNPDRWTLADERYVRIDSGQYVPEDVQRVAARELRTTFTPQTAKEMYRGYVEATYLQSWWIDPIILLLFLGVMYVVGGLFAADAARVMYRLFEYFVQRVPLVRAVYVPVKQVTGYFFDREGPRFSRVVAVEYPRRGIWTLAFVTGEGLADIERITGEPMLTILFPTCPVPVTGNVKVIAKREVIDLDVTIEAAAQYVVSYGVVIDEASVKRGALPSPEVVEREMPV